MAPELGRCIHKEVRDGVPVFWTPEAPRTAGALMFRAGSSDEGVTTRGITHLVEHLSLYKLGFEPTYERNGFVDGTHTVYWASGTPQQIVSFLRHVSHAVSQLPLDRLEAESRVLRTEAAGRQLGIFDRFLWLRFGARGHGLGYLPEFMLEAPNPLAIRTWAADRFTAENAVAWFSGALPDDLRFEELPRGRRIPSADATPIEGLRPPTFLPDSSGAVGISFLTDRDDWISIPLWVARTRLMQRLRFQDGLTYSVQCAIHHLNSHQSHSVLWATCLPEHGAAVKNGLLEVLEELARDGPSLAELQQARDLWIQHAEQAESAFEDLDNAATNEILGSPSLSLQAYLDQFDERPVDRWAASMQTALRTAILALPPGIEPGRTDVLPYPLWSKTVASGRTYRTIRQRFPWSKKEPELVVGKSAVSLVTPAGEAVTVPYQACAGAVIHADGTLQIIGEDGFAVAIAAHEWRDGEQARSEVLQKLPLDRVIEYPRR